VELARADDQPDPQPYERLLDRVMASQPDTRNDLRDATRLSHLYEKAAAAYRHAGSVAQADAIEACRRDLWRAWQRKFPGNAFVERQPSSSAE